MKLLGKLLVVSFLSKFLSSSALISPNSFLRSHPILAVRTINFLTHKLPMVDTFGHKNLEMNDQLIPLILDNNQLSTPLKAELVTGLIRFSQFGDNFCSWILSHYLELITYLVNSLQ